MQTKKINQTPQPTFQAYIKFKDKPHTINKLRNLIKHNSDEYLCANYQKRDNKSILEVLSGRQADKFLDLVGTIDHRELRSNLAKYLGESPKKGNADKFIKKLDKKA